jgi:hypothetical protein
MIALPILNSVVPFSIRTQISEKRELAQRPRLGTDTLLSYPDEYEEYFNDNFGFRNLLIRWNSALKVKYLKVSPVPSKVIIGNNNWLFYADEGALENYKRRFLFEDDFLENIRRNEEARGDWLKSRGIGYYLVFVPEKQTVYPEFMPAYIKRYGGHSKLDQVVSYLKKYSKVKVIDLREDLLTQKKWYPKYLLYDRLGTHWNQYGAYVGYRQLLDVISKDFPTIKPLKEDSYNIRYEAVKRGELTDMMGLEHDTLFTEEVIRYLPKKASYRILKGNLQPDKIVPLVITENQNSSLPRLVMLRDSFATQMIYHISENFSRCVYIWNMDIWIFTLDTSAIEREKPLIVINEVQERYISSLGQN